MGDNLDSIMTQLAKFLILSGFLICATGMILYFGGKVFGFGRLPGDIIIKRNDVTFYFPIATCLIISTLLTLILKFFQPPS